MRTWLKSLATKVLARKAKNLLKHSHARRFLVIGGTNRFIMKDELARLLPGTLVASKPGYTYKLGLALTILGTSAGVHSLFRWVKMVFNNYPEFKADSLIVEFAISDIHDAEFIADVLNPEVCVIADAQAVSAGFTNELRRLQELLPEMILIAPENLRENQEIKNGEVWYGKGPENDIQLVEVKESQAGTVFRYRIGNESGQETAHSYGEHYLYPRLIVHYVNQHGLGAKK